MSIIHTGHRPDQQVRHTKPNLALLASLLAILMGVVLLAVGFGVGLPHLAKGARVTGLVGFVALVVGGGLLLLGLLKATRRLHGWTRAVVIAIAVPLVLVLTYSMSIALAVTNVPLTEVGGALPSDHGAEFVDVELLTSDGVTLSGWYIPSTNTAALVLLHGAGSTRSNVLEHAVVLSRHGYGVVLMDARGHGRSTGRAMDFGWYGDRDIAAAVDFLTRQSNVDPARVGVVGLSMGGEQAVGAAANDPRIHAVVGEGVTGRTAEDKAWLSEEYGVRGWVQQRIDGLTYALTDTLTPADPPISMRNAVEAAAPTPILLITAGTVSDEVAVAERLRAASPATVEIWTVADVQHTQGLAEQSAEWERRVTEFLERSLRL